MFFNKTKRELKLLTAFQKIFFDEHKKLTAEAKTVLAFLRNEPVHAVSWGKTVALIFMIIIIVLMPMRRRFF